MTKPSIAELLNASGHTTYTPELVQRAMSALYGNVGANLDARNWTTILQSANALETAEAGLKSMYQDRTYLLNNIAHLSQQGYVPAQAEITYRQMADRLGFTHNTGWSAGTAYANLGPLSMSELVALVPVVTPPSTGGGTFTVTAGGSGAYTVGTGNGNVVVTDDGTNFVFTPAVGIAVNVAKASLTGTLTVGGAIKLTGAAAVLKLLTGITGAVTVSDIGSVPVGELIDIGGKASGDVTVTNAVAITGTAAQMMAALVTSLTKVIAATANVTINGAVVLADLTDIHNATSGTVTIQGDGTNETWDFGGFTAGDLVINGLGGNDTITGGSGNDTIHGGDGSDTITGGLGNNIITGGMGTDTLTGGADNDTITGGADNDTIALVTGSDVVVFEATAAQNGLDTITGFNAGALAGGGDVLKVSAFLGAPTLTAVVTDAAIGNQAVANGNILRVTDAGDDLDAATIALLFGGGGKPLGTITSGDKYVLITDGGKVWFINTALDGDNTNLTATDIVQVGTIGTVVLSALVADNFA